MIIFLLSFLVSSTIYSADFNCLHFLFDHRSSPPDTEQPGNPITLNLFDAELTPIVNHETIITRLSNEELQKSSSTKLQKILEQIRNQAAEDQKKWEQNYDNCCYKSSCVAVSMPSAGMITGCIQAVPITPIEGCFLGGLASIPCCIVFLCYYLHTRQQEIESVLQYESEIKDIITRRSSKPNLIIMSE